MGLVGTRSPRSVSPAALGASTPTRTRHRRSPVQTRAIPPQEKPSDRRPVRRPRPAGGFPVIVDLFSGPGGWDEGLRIAAYTGPLIGVEFEEWACRTALAAGHARLLADVAALDPAMFLGVEGLIASPPCQAWSMAGDRKGELDRPEVYTRITAYARDREPVEVAWHDERSRLTAEPMRYIVALMPQWIALEQVPPVLPLWEHYAVLLRELGYQTWTGVLSAERYGVPQTRRRAILMARRDGLMVGPPEPTHRAYGDDNDHASLFGDPLPSPVSMAEALGWGLPDRPAWTVTADGTETGGAEVFGNAKNREHLREVVAQARNSGPGAERDPRPIDAPSYTVRANGSGSHPSGTEWVLQNGSQDNATARAANEPAGTIYCSRPGNFSWSLRNGNQVNACERRSDEPAGTLFFGQRTNAVDWQDGEKSVRVTVQEAAILQGFRPDYPWQGTKSAQYRQVGDAVPPPLAAAILRPLLAAPTAQAAA